MGFATGFRFGQLGQETPGLRRPLASHFQDNHHWTGSSVDSHKLWVRACLPLSCCFQSHSINIRSTSPRGPTSPECTHQRRVQRELCSSKQGKAIRHNFETSSIRALQMLQIKITDHDVGRDSAPCLSANPRQHALQSKPSPPQNSSPPARSTVVATRIKWTATPASTRSQRERQSKVWKEQNPEELRAERRGRTGGATRERQSCPRSALRPHKGSPRSLHLWEDLDITEMSLNT